MKSTETAVRITEYIAKSPGMKKAQIADALGITPSQFQGAVPYIRRLCELSICRWYVRGFAPAPIPKKYYIRKTKGDRPHKAGGSPYVSVRLFAGQKEFIKASGGAPYLRQLIAQAQANPVSQ